MTPHIGCCHSALGFVCDEQSRGIVMLSNRSSFKYAHEIRRFRSTNCVAVFGALASRGTAAATFTFLLSVCMLMMPTTSLAQTPDPDSVFSDLSPEYDGGVANPTDGSTGNVL